MLLSSPSIIGTALFLSAVVVSGMFGPGNGRDPAREFTAADRVKLAIEFTLFLACYFGAAFGPILLPLAAHQAFALTRAIGARARRTISAWTFVVLGVVATALFGDG